MIGYKFCQVFICGLWNAQLSLWNATERNSACLNYFSVEADHRNLVESVVF
jgi:hypothetical protein